MKKILGIAALSMGVMLTSCSDFLDQKADSALDQENVFNSSYFTGLEINKFMVISDRIICMPTV